VAGLLIAAAVICVVAPSAHAASLQLPWPTGEVHRINSAGSGYGCDFHVGRTQYAIDFDHAEGQAVSSVAEGAARSAYHDQLGKYVWIDHGEGLVSIYAHLSAFAGSFPRSVAQGEVIGAAGNTGTASTGAHLHFVMRTGASGPFDGNAFRPEPMSGYSGFGAYGCGRGTSPAYTSRPVADGPLGDGSFVSVAETGRVYRIAGGSPIYVTSWSVYGGPQPTTRISAAQFRRYSAFPKEGTFIRAAQTNKTYRIAGGAPVYVSSWSAFGGQKSSIAVDGWSIDNAGDPESHMRARPAEGTFLSASPGNRIYRVAGGAPTYVSSWNAFGGSQPNIAVDQWSVDNAGHRDSHMRAISADGTFVRAAPTSAVYRIAGGAPVYVSTWNAFDGPKPSIAIDRWSIDNAGNALSHLLKNPRDGSFVRAAQTGAVYRVAGGAPIYVSTWDAFGGKQGYTDIDEWAIDNRGSERSHLRRDVSDRTFVRVANGSSGGLITRAAGGALLGLTSCEPLGGCRGAINVDHVGFRQYEDANPRPSDGTLLQGLPSGEFWRIEDGVRRPTSGGDGVVSVNDSTVRLFPREPAPAKPDPLPLPSSPAPSSPAPSAPALGAPPFASKLEVERARVLRSDRRLDVLAPITARAAGELGVAFRAAGRTESFEVEIDSENRRARFSEEIPASQARLGTGILTLTYGGDADTQPQEVRLRAASGRARLDAGRPAIEDGRLKAQGTISSRARGVVRLQLLYEPPGQGTRTLEYTARIVDGEYAFDEELSQSVLDGIDQRAGVVHSYTLFTGYFPRRIRGEMQSYQVLE
jgi:hypothetical protein